MKLTRTHYRRPQMTKSLIHEAADMIAEFSPVTAALFRSRPFHRTAIADAFRAGFKTHNAYTLKVCAFVTLAATRDMLDRAVKVD